MPPTEPRRDTAQGVPPAQPQAPTGATAWVINKIWTLAAAHEAPQTLSGDRKIAPQLVDDIAAKVTKAIVAKAESAFVAGGSEQIKPTLSDLFSQIVLKLSTKDIPNPSACNDEELIEQFFVNIIAIFTKEFAKRLDVKEHFKNIANTLLVETFPKKIDDPHLPIALRQILQGKGIYAWALSFKVDTKALTWDQLVNYFADNLEKIYSSLHYSQEALLTEENSPGIQAFIDKIAPEEKTVVIKSNIAFLTEKSNELINNFIKRLLANKNPNVAEARKWVQVYIKQNIRIVISILFDPNERGQRVKNIADYASSRLQALEREEKATQAFLRDLMGQEFAVAKLQELFPQFLTMEDAFEQLSASLAPYVLQVIKQCDTIRQEPMDDDIVSGVDKGLSQLRKIIEAKALAGTLVLTGFPFIDECVCHLLKPSENSVAKEYLVSLLKSLAQSVINGAKRENETAAEALGSIVNRVLEQGRIAVANGTNLQDASRAILATVITKKKFISMLPEFLKESILWDSSADLLADYLKGMNVHAGKGTRTLQVPALNELLQTGVKKLIALVKQEATEKKTALDRLKGVIIGKGLLQLMEQVLPTFLEAILAYHVNPQGTKSSEKRAAELFFTIMSITDAGFERMEQATNSEEWLFDNGYTKEQVADYRKTYDIPRKNPTDVKDFLLREINRKLVATLLPEKLMQEIIPQEFAPFHLDQLVENLVYDFVKQAQEFSHIMKSFSVTTMAVRPDLDVRKIQALLGGEKSEKEAFWVKGAIQEVFATKDEKEKALFEKLFSKMLVGALGLMMAKSEGLTVEQDLLSLLAPILKNGQQAFLLLNKNKSEKALGISRQEIQRYKKVIGEEKYDIKQLTYWVLARRGLGKLLRDDEWEKLVPEFLRSMLSKDVVANLLCPIYERVHEVQAPLQREAENGGKRVAQEEGLKTYIDDTIIRAINEALIDLGNKDKPLSDTLPPLFDGLIKQILAEKGDIGDIRSILVERIVYAVFEGLLRDKAQLTDKLVTLFSTFKQGDHAVTARMLVTQLLPKKLSELPLSKLLIDQVVLPEVTKDLSQLQGSLSHVEKRGAEAGSYLATVEGVRPLVNTMLKSLDETLDEMAKDPHNMTKGLPGFVDGELKKVLANKDLAPTIKMVIHSLLQISLQEAFTPQNGQTVEEKVLEVMGKLIQLYDAPTTQETATEWLKVLMPEKILQELLPEFLRPVFTHEKLAKWFFVPYVEEVKETHKRAVEMQGPLDTPRMQQFVKEQLVGLAASKKGISGFGGVVRGLEQSILSTKSEVTDPYLKGVVSQVMTALQDSGRLDKQFLSAGLIDALSSQAVVPADFGKQAAQKLLAILLPKGAASLLVPDVAKKAVWAKLEKGMEEFFTEMKTSPIQWTIKRLIPFTTDDQALRDKRLEEMDSKDPEKLLKEYFVDACVRQADEQMKKSNLWAPFKWIARQFVKVLTYFVARFSLQDRFYAFLKAPDCGEKIARFIWAFLQYEHPAGTTVQTDELSTELSTAFQRFGLLPGMLLSPVSSRAANFLAGKNIVDVLT